MEIKFKNITLQLGSITFNIISEREITLNEEYLPFVVDGEKSDVTIKISWDWENAQKPASKIIGDDVFAHYHIEQDGTRFSMTKGGQKGYIACTRYDDSFKELFCTINEKPFIEPHTELSGIIRFLPIREVFLHHEVLFFHSAQIGYKGRGILFTAPSQTGKTTQAKLWKKYRNADIICNDRTLIRKIENSWLTYGYPLDGSEPVRSNKVNELGCIVVLRQSPICEIHRLGAAKAVSMLMGQMVMDTWSGEAKVRIMNLLLKLLEEKPIYLLSCTPDEDAVRTLETQLKLEGVL